MLKNKYVNSRDNSYKSPIRNYFVHKFVFITVCYCIAGKCQGVVSGGELQGWPL